VAPVSCYYSVPKIVSVYVKNPSELPSFATLVFFGWYFSVISEYRRSADGGRILDLGEVNR
jgi:hypothetical protein